MSRWKLEEEGYYLIVCPICGATFDEVGFKLRYDKKQGDSKMRVSSTMKNSLGAAIRLRKLRKKT